MSIKEVAPVAHNSSNSVKMAERGCQEHCFDSLDGSTPLVPPAEPRHGQRAQYRRLGYDCNFGQLAFTSGPFENKTPAQALLYFPDRVVRCVNRAPDTPASVLFRILMDRFDRLRFTDGCMVCDAMGQVAVTSLKPMSRARVLCESCLTDEIALNGCSGLVCRTIELAVLSAQQRPGNPVSNAQYAVRALAYAKGLPDFTDKGIHTWLHLQQY